MSRNKCYFIKIKFGCWTYDKKGHLIKEEWFNIPSVAQNRHYPAESGLTAKIYTKEWGLHFCKIIVEMFLNFQEKYWNCGKYKNGVNIRK